MKLVLFILLSAIAMGASTEVTATKNTEKKKSLSYDYVDVDDPIGHFLVCLSSSI